MEILNLICYGSAVLFVGAVLVVLVFAFFTSVYSCFTKKIEGKLLSKLAVALTFGCVCPWVLKLLLYLIGRII